MNYVHKWWCVNRASEMHVFVKVVQSDGFSAAARQLGMTPSAVSKLIGRLEERLGVRLLQRTTRSIGVTEEGQAFYERCMRILADIDDAEQAVGRINAVVGGTLRINAAVAFATYQVVPLLPEFVARHPLVKLEMTVTDRIVDLVDEGADLGVRIGARFESTLVSRLLAEDHRIIVASPEYLAQHGTPLKPEDLSRHNCLAWSGEHRGLNDWPFEGPGGTRTMRAQGNTKVNNGETLFEMTLAGLGVARLAEFRVGAAIRSKRLVPLLQAHHRADPLPIHAVYPHRHHLSPKVRAFVDFLVEKFTPIPPWAVSRSDTA